MNYKYLLGMRLATPNTSISLNQKPFIDIIKKAVMEYNIKSGSAPNPKQIKISPNDIYADEFIITLYSQNELVSAGKALRLFSQIIANSGEFEEGIKNRKLFTTFPVTQIDGKSSIIEPEKLSDVEIVKALLDYICCKSNSNSTIYKRKRAAMTQIKQIALESGIYNINSENDI